MAKLARLAGRTSQTVYVFLQDTSKTNGAGLTGLAYNTSGLVAYFVRTRGSSTSLTLVTQTVTGAWASGGFVEVDATNIPGLYRLDLPNAMLATGADSTVLYLQGATNMAFAPLEIDLTAWDAQAGSVVTATNVTNAPTSGDFTTAQKSSLNAATPASIQGGIGGDLAGKVLGGGASSIGGVGAWAAGGSGAVLATQSQVNTLENNTTTRLAIPEWMLIPASGSIAYICEIAIQDETGQLAAPDATPTITAVDESGTSLAANLGAITSPGTGAYMLTYTSASTGTNKQVRWSVSYTRNTGANSFFAPFTTTMAAQDPATVNANVVAWNGASPANLDGSGFPNVHVQAMSTNVTVGAYATNEDPATLLASSFSPLATESALSTAQGTLNTINTNTSSIPSASTIATAVWSVLTSALTVSNSIGARILAFFGSGNYTAQTGDSFARLGVPAGASISADIAAAASSASAAASSASSAATILADGSHGNAALADLIESATVGAITGTVSASPSPTTTTFTVAMSSTPLVGQILIFSDGAANPGQALTIATVSGSNSATALTFESGKSFTLAPVSGDTFQIGGAPA